MLKTQQRHLKRRKINSIISLLTLAGAGLLAYPTVTSAAFMLPSTDGTTTIHYNPFAGGYGAADTGREGVWVHMPRGWATSAANAKYDVVMLLPGTNMEAEGMAKMLKGSNKPGDTNFSRELNNEVIFIIPNEGSNKTQTNEPKQWTGFKRGSQPPYAIDPNSFWDFKRLIQLRNDLKADNPKVRNIYVGGFSAGGSMTRMLMCFAGNKFAGYGVFDGIKSSLALYNDCGRHWNNGGDVALEMIDKLGYPPVGFGVNSPAPAGQKYVRPVFMTTMTHSGNSGYGDLGNLYDTGLADGGRPGSVLEVTSSNGSGVPPAPGTPGDITFGRIDNKDKITQSNQNAFESPALFSMMVNSEHKPHWQYGFEHFRGFMGSSAAYRTAIPNNSAGLSFSGTTGIVYYNTLFPFAGYLPGALQTQPAGPDCTADFCYRFSNAANYCANGKSLFQNLNATRSGTLSVYMYINGSGTNPNGASGKTGLTYIETRGGKHHIAGRAGTCDSPGTDMEIGRTRDYDTAQLFIKFLQARAGLRRTH